MNKLACLTLIVSGLVACSSYVSKSDYAYLHSQNGIKIEVPAPLTGSSISNFYDLPDQTQNAKVSIEPPSQTDGMNTRE